MSTQTTKMKPMNVPTTEKPRWPRAVALEIAQELTTRLKPHCERIIIAGSIRRRKAEVGDIEILFVPKMEVRPLDMFATVNVSLADEEIERMLADDTLAKRPSRIGGTSWGTRNKLAVHRSGVPVDLFATTEAAWWNYLVCRTGPADLNAKIAGRAKSRGLQWNPYGEGFTNLRNGSLSPMTSEADVFRFVGLAYAEPWDRQ